MTVTGYELNERRNEVTRWCVCGQSSHVDSKRGSFIGGLSVRQSLTSEVIEADGGRDYERVMSDDGSKGSDMA